MNELRLDLGGACDRMACASAAIRFAREAGAGPRQAHEIGLCVAELVSNVERHATRGRLVMRVVEGGRAAVEIEVEDEGPGIADVPSALRDGWSRGRMAEVGEPLSRRSLGVGLGTLRRLTDHLEIRSAVGAGTRVVARKWLCRGM